MLEGNGIGTKAAGNGTNRNDATPNGTWYNWIVRRTKE
jgi:hypothetical protein